MTSIAPENIQQTIDRLHDLLERGADDAALHDLLQPLHPADIAVCFESVDPEIRSRLMFLLPPQKWAEAVTLMEDAVRSDVLEDMTNEQVADVLNRLSADDAVDVLHDLEADVAEKVFKGLDPDQQAELEPLRQYPEESAGGIMDTELISVHEDTTVGDAIEIIRQLTPEETEQVFYLYMTDENNVLTGVVPAIRLITARRDRRVQDLAIDDMFTAHVDDDQEVVKNKFDRYDVAMLPVVDNLGHLLGVITHDDVLDVAGEEAEEDMLHMGGTDAAEFATTSILRAASIRARWLIPCLIGTFVAALITQFLQPELGDLARIVVPFVIPIAAMGGNAGVQTSTVIIRALAGGESLTFRLQTAVAREFRIALVVGAATGLMAGAGAYTIVGWERVSHVLLDDLPDNPPVVGIAIAIGTSMAIAILAAGSLAMTLPFIFRRLGVDPAIATGPVITTLNDSVSAAIYLGISIMLLTP